MRYLRDDCINNTYFKDLFIRPDILVNRLAKAIKKEFPTCDGIVASSGLSGAAIVVPVAMKLKMRFAFVRIKKSHSFEKVEGHCRIRNPVIIDDFIETGKTMKNTINILMAAGKPPCGIICYGEHSKKRYRTYKREFSFKFNKNNETLKMIIFS
jgi:adenine/guanine phosphoribosyltransferase-like PRPP-binding protein